MDDHSRIIAVFVLVLLVLFSGPTHAIGIDVEIDLGNKTILWADNLFSKFEILLGKEIADLDEILKGHEDYIFEKIAELGVDAKDFLVCSEEKANQDLNNLLARLGDNRGFLGRLMGPKERYPVCGNYLEMNIAQSASLRESAVCAYQEALNDPKRSYETSWFRALSEDLSLVFFSRWCILLHTPGFKNNTDEYMSAHSAYAELTTAWSWLNKSGNPKCSGTKDIDNCAKIFIEHAESVVAKAHPMDVRNAAKLLADLKKHSSSNISRIEQNEVIGNAQYVLNFIEKARGERIDALKGSLNVLLKDLNEMSDEVIEVTEKYKQANIACDAKDWKRTNVILEIGTQNSAYNRAQRVLWLINKYKKDFTELTSKLGDSHQSKKKRVEEKIQLYTKQSDGWKLNNTFRSSKISKCSYSSECGRVSYDCSPGGFAR